MTTHKGGGKQIKLFDASAGALHLATWLTCPHRHRYARYQNGTYPLTR